MTMYLKIMLDGEMEEVGAFDNANTLGFQIDNFRGWVVKQDSGDLLMIIEKVTHNKCTEMCRVKLPC